jgi:hypothetical protein
MNSDLLYSIACLILCLGVTYRLYRGGSKTDVSELFDIAEKMAKRSRTTVDDTFVKLFRELVGNGKPEPPGTRAEKNSSRPASYV